MSDIRQYLYCPRIIYWRRVLRVGGAETPLMRRGKERQDRAVREAIRLVPLRGCRVERDVILKSERLGLWGRLDGLLHCGERAYPLEVKFASPARSHRIQLAAYAMLIEENFDVEVREGFLYYPGGLGLVRVDSLRKLRREVMRALEGIRRILEEEYMPPPTPNKGKCAVCEHFLACRGV